MIELFLVVFLAPPYVPSLPMSLQVILCTFPDRETAQRIATTLVEAGLVACANLLPGVQSIYRWEGRTESSSEVLALMKTTTEAYPQLEAKLKELHPYDVPKIIAVPVDRAEAAYAKWVIDMTARREG